MNSCFVQKISEINKQNRAKLEDTHCMGTKSLPVVIDEKVCLHSLLLNYIFLYETHNLFGFRKRKTKECCLNVMWYILTLELVRMEQLSMTKLLMLL